MADCEVKAAKMARILAIVHIIIVFFLICFGIADAFVIYFWTSFTVSGIWSGGLMCIAGCLGIPGTRKERSNSRNSFASIFLGFSITCAVAGGVIIICYGISIASHRYDYKSFEFDDHRPDRPNEYHRYYYSEMAFSIVILVLGVVEFVVGIWATVCLCLMKPCTCCNEPPPQQGLVTYTANAGYVITQGPGGGPVAIPMQNGDGMVAMQTVTLGTQGYQPQMVMAHASEVECYQSQLSQVAPAGATGAGYLPQKVQATQAVTMATDYEPLQVHIPPLYTQSEYDEASLSGRTLI